MKDRVRYPRQSSSTALPVSFLFFLFALAGPLPSAAAPADPLLQYQIKELRDELDEIKKAQPDQTSRLVKLESGLEALQKRIDDVTSAQAARIQDIQQQSGSDLAWFGAILAGVSALTTVIVIILAWQATRTAKTEARQTAEQWFDGEGKGVIEKLINSLREQGDELLEGFQANVQALLEKDKTHFETEIQRLLGEAERKFEGFIQESRQKHDTVLNDAIAKSAKLDEIARKLEASVTSKGGETLSEQESRQLSETAEEVRGKPEGERNYQDWRILYSQALETKNYDEALRCVEKMEAVPGSEAETIGSKISRALVSSYLDGDFRSELAVYDEIIGGYGQRDEPDIAEQVARALFNKGAVLADLGQKQEAIDVYDEVDRRYGGRTEVGIAEPVAKALFNKGVVLAELGRKEEAVAAYDEVDRRYGDRTEAGIAVQATSALVRKGLGLAELGEKRQAIAAYEEVIRRYGERPEEAIRQLVEIARSNLALLEKNA